MSDDRPAARSRRDFLTGIALREPVAAEIDAPVYQSLPSPPVAGDTVRLQTRAMACDFAVILNPDRGDQIPAASEALELVDDNIGWLAEDGWVIVQIDPKEYKPFVFEALEEFEQRQYGTTLLVFYERK